jgi:hypothetical protein
VQKKNAGALFRIKKGKLLVELGILKVDNADGVILISFSQKITLLESLTPAAN